MSYSFVQVDAFTPNSGSLTPVGNVTWVRSGNTFTLTRNDARALQISFLGPKSFRVRFNPAINPDYSTDRSFTVVSRDLGTVNLQVDDFQTYLCIDTGALQLQLDLQPYRIQVFRQGQLICADEPSYNLVFIPG